MRENRINSVKEIQPYLDRKKKEKHIVVHWVLLVCCIQQPIVCGFGRRNSVIFSFLTQLMHSGNQRIHLGTFEHSRKSESVVHVLSHYNSTEPQESYCKLRHYPKISCRPLPNSTGMTKELYVLLQWSANREHVSKNKC